MRKPDLCGECFFYKEITSVTGAMRAEVTNRTGDRLSAFFPVSVHSEILKKLLERRQANRIVRESE